MYFHFPLQSAAHEYIFSLNTLPPPHTISNVRDCEQEKWKIGVCLTASCWKRHWQSASGVRCAPAYWFLTLTRCWKLIWQTCLFDLKERVEERDVRLFIFVCTGCINLHKTFKVGRWYYEINRLTLLSLSTPVPFHLVLRKYWHSLIWISHSSLDKKSEMDNKSWSLTCNKSNVYLTFFANTIRRCIHGFHSGWNILGRVIFSSFGTEAFPSPYNTCGDICLILWDI